MYEGTSGNAAPGYSVLVAILALICMSPAQSFPSIQYNLATIVDSGSTNRWGFRIAVRRSGAAEYRSIPRGANAQHAEPAKRRVNIPGDLAARLFADLEAARPLSSLPAPHCMKSASFGSRLTIEFGGQTTPDLSCGDGGDERLRALIKDVNDMVALVKQTEP